LDTVKKALYMLGEFKSRLPFMLLLFIIVSMIDIVGIGLIGPFIALLGSESKIVLDYPFLFTLLGDVNNEEVIKYLGFILIITFVSKGFVSFAVQKKILSLGYEIRTNLIERLVKSYQSMKYEEVIKRDISSLIVNTNTHVGLFVDSVFVPILRLLIEVVVVIGIMILMAFTSPLAMLGISLILVILLAIYFKYIKARLYKYGRVMSKKEEDIICGIKHVTGAFREIRLLGVENFFSTDIKNNVITFGEAGVITRSLHLVSRYLIEASMITFIVLIVIYMIYDSKTSTEIFSTLGVFAVGAIRLVPSVSQIGLGVANVRTGSYALHELHSELKLIDSFSRYTTYELLEDNEKFKNLNLTNINYSYTPEKESVFSNVNMLINKGDFIGIIGESGAGKSTLMDIMLGLLSCSSGHLKINDYNIDSHDPDDSRLRWWQNKCAYIPQDVFLINGTIKENIALGLKEEEIDLEKLSYAINGANLQQLITQQGKSGFNSLVGEQGSWLSGGQKQRIALARALYADREVIFMDEATSALDQETEENIMNFIGSLKDSITVILITHRKATLKNCNKIYRLIDGELQKDKI